MTDIRIDAQGALCAASVICSSTSRSQKPYTLSRSGFMAMTRSAAARASCGVVTEISPGVESEPFPTCLKIGPARNRRGPGVRPASMSARSRCCSASGPPVSRNVVTPAMTLTRATSAMIRGSRAWNLTGNSVGVPSPACIRWPWLSHSPGMIVMPDASMTLTPEGTPSCPMRPTLAIVSPAIRTTASSIGSPPNPSTRRPPAIASVTPGGGAARDGCGDRASDRSRGSAATR